LGQSFGKYGPSQIDVKLATHSNDGQRAHVARVVGPAGPRRRAQRGDRQRNRALCVHRAGASCVACTRGCSVSSSSARKRAQSPTAGTPAARGLARACSGPQHAVQCAAGSARGLGWPCARGRARRVGPLAMGPTPVLCPVCCSKASPTDAVCAVLCVAGCLRGAGYRRCSGAAPSRRAGVVARCVRARCPESGGQTFSAHDARRCLPKSLETAASCAGALLRPTVLC